MFNSHFIKYFIKIISACVHFSFFDQFFSFHVHIIGTQIVRLIISCPNFSFSFNFTEKAFFNVLNNLKFYIFQRYLKIVRSLSLSIFNRLSRKNAAFVHRDHFYYFICHFLLTLLSAPVLTRCRLLCIHRRIFQPYAFLLR